MVKQLIKLFVTALLLAGCGVPPAPPAVASTTPSLTDVTLGLGFIPSVQFAPFYVALERGYYAQEGLNLKFQNGNEDDYLKLVGTNQLQFMVGSGEQVILGRAQGLPVTYVMRWYNRFPVVVFSLQDKGITQPKDLIGKRVGIPGLFGASYIGWKALLYSQKINEKDITLQSIGFTQGELVAQGQIDAAIDYVASGPVQLRQAGKAVNVIRISDYLDIPANGLITNEQTIKNRPDLVASMVRASLKGLADTLQNPNDAFVISLKYVPDAGGANQAANQAIFTESLPLWRSDGPPGASRPDAWQNTAQFMRTAGLIDKDIVVDDAYTNRFIAAK